MSGVTFYNPWTGAALWIVIGVSLGVSALYSIRVLRGHRDPFKWALLGLLLSLALTNLPILAVYIGHPFLPIAGVILRLIATVFLLWASWPLIKDSWHEAMVCLRIIKQRGEDED